MKEPKKGEKMFIKSTKSSRPLMLYTGDKPQELAGIRVRILAQAYARMMMYINACDHEVSGLGRVKKTRKQDSYGRDYDEYLVTDIRIFQQTSDNANTNLRASGEFGMAAFFEKMLMAGEDSSGWHCWWHSHVNMIARFSDVDEAQCRKFFEKDEDGWHLEIVGNKRNEFQVRFDRFGEYVDFCDQMALEIVFDEDPALLAEVRSEIAKKVVKPVPTIQRLPTETELGSKIKPSRPKKGFVGQILEFIAGGETDKKSSVNGDVKRIKGVKVPVSPPLPKNIPSEPSEEIVSFRKLDVAGKNETGKAWFAKLQEVIATAGLNPDEIYRLAASRVKESEEQLRLMIRFCDPDYVPVCITDGERLFYVLEAALELARLKSLVSKTWTGTGPLDKRAPDDAESMRTLASFTLEDCSGLQDEDVVQVACAWMQELAEIIERKEGTVELIASVSRFDKSVIEDRITNWNLKQYVPLVEHTDPIYRVLGVARRMAAANRWMAERDRIAAGFIRDFKACANEAATGILIRSWCDEVYVLASSCRECKEMNRDNIIKLSGITPSNGVENNVDDILNCKTIEKWWIKSADLPRILAVVRMISSIHQRSLEEEAQKVKAQSETKPADSDEQELGDDSAEAEAVPTQSVEKEDSELTPEEVQN